ncbi:MAG: protein kinase [Planctomycetes bacterium]|nr:protein kinase [Planctomycetota bacterium]
MSLPERLGEYKILRELGRGGMGVVYEATQDSLGRHVALKVISKPVGDDDKAVERFHREAVTAAGLTHPGIAQIFETGRSDGLHYIAMELVHGEGLDRLIDSVWRPSPEGSAEDTFEVSFTPSSTGSLEIPPPNEQTTQLPKRGPGRFGPEHLRLVSLVAQAARGVEYAHEHGVVHRDLKPQNLLVSREGQVKIVDFGLARQRGMATLTETGLLMGTPLFMAPEQIRDDRSRVDHRADVHALGVTLYRAICGDYPYQGETVESILHRIAQVDPDPPRSFNAAVPADLETVCLHAIEKDPDHRYQTAGELAADLERFLVGEAIVARPLATWKRIVRRVRRGGRGVAIMSLVTGAALLLVAWLVSMLLQDSGERKSIEAHRVAGDGLAAAILGDHKEALGRFDEAIQLDPDCVEAWVHRGLCRLELRDTEGAGRDLDAAVKIDPDFASLGLARKSLLFRLGAGPRPEPSEGVLRAGSDPLSLDSLAIVLESLGESVAARALFVRAREMQTSRQSSVLGEAICQLTLGRHEEARRLFGVVAALNSENPVPKVWQLFALFRAIEESRGDRQSWLLGDATTEGAELLRRVPGSSLAAAIVSRVSGADFDPSIVEGVIQDHITIPEATRLEFLAEWCAETDPETAAKLARRAQLKDPSTRFADFILARLAERSEATEEAVGYYLRCLDRLRDYPAALGALLRIARRNPEWVPRDPPWLDAAARRVLLIVPDEPTLFLQAARWLAGRGFEDEVRQALPRLEELLRSSGGELARPEVQAALDEVQSLLRP